MFIPDNAEQNDGAFFRAGQYYIAAEDIPAEQYDTCAAGKITRGSILQCYSYDPDRQAAVMLNMQYDPKKIKFVCDPVRDRCYVRQSEHLINCDADIKEFEAMREKDRLLRNRLKSGTAFSLIRDIALFALFCIEAVGMVIVFAARIVPPFLLMLCCLGVVFCTLRVCKSLKKPSASKRMAKTLREAARNRRRSEDAYYIIMETYLTFPVRTSSRAEVEAYKKKLEQDIKSLRTKYKPGAGRFIYC